MTKLAKQIAFAREELGLTADELVFYDALTKPRAIKDFYENKELLLQTLLWHQKNWSIRKNLFE